MFLVVAWWQLDVATTNYRFSLKGNSLCVPSLRQVIPCPSLSGFVLLTPSPSKQGHPELLARRRAASPRPSAGSLPRGSVLLHRPPAGQPGGHSAAHRGESPTGVPRSAALLQRYLESVSSLQPTVKVKTGYYSMKMTTNGGKSVHGNTMIRY